MGVFQPLGKAIGLHLQNQLAPGGAALRVAYHHKTPGLAVAGAGGDAGGLDYLRHLFGGHLPVGVIAAA